MNLPAITKALDRMIEIMQEPAVTEMRGYAYTDDEPELIKRAMASLAAIDLESNSHVANVMNGKYLADAVMGAEKAHVMLGRVGFAEIKGIAWVDRDQRIIEEGYEAAMLIAGRGRS